MGTKGFILLVFLLIAVLSGCGSFDTKFNFFGGNSSPITVSTTTLAAASVGVSYSQSLTASGGTAPYSWTISSGTLPAGLSMDTSGNITGIPSVSSVTSTFTVKVSDSATTPNTASQSLTIQVAGTGSIIITSQSLPDGAVSTPYAGQLLALGGSGSYSWTITAGSLPAGLTLANATGLISGTPTIAETAQFTVTVTDPANSQVSASLNYILPVRIVTIITGSPLPPAAKGLSFSQTFLASGGTGLYTWSIPGNLLPNGLALNQATGVLAGVPSLSGTYNLPVTVSDGSSNKTLGFFFLQVNGSGGIPTIQATLLPAAPLNTWYSQQLTATGGTLPYIWTLASGSVLPAGLSLNSSGVVSGVPTATGVTTVTVKVADTATVPLTAQQTLTITVQ